MCNPTYCEYAKDYHDKVAKHEIKDLLSKKKKLSSRVFKKLGEEFEVCPFELQFEAAQEADTIICDYNYVFASQTALARVPQTTFAQEGFPNLVIDEAHNLPSRAMGYYSPSLSSFLLEKMREHLRRLPKRFAKEAEELLDDCIQILVSCRPLGCVNTVRIEPDARPFLDQDTKLSAFLSRYLDSDIEIETRDPVLKLCFYWSEFAQLLEQIAGLDQPEFFTTYQPDRTGGIVKITCADASEMLKPSYDQFNQVIAFSATLKPFDYYASLSGLKSETLKTAEFQSPFSTGHRKLLIIPQISTKYSDRERNYARIAEAISKIASLRVGNYFAFFPSFDFLERVLSIMPHSQQFQIVKQERSMKADDIETILEDLKSETTPTLVFGVQGGVFSEGVDYPGNMIIGAFIIGPPLPNFDVERETMRKYYDEHYGEKRGDGFDYAYTYPAMAKAVQAAGRVIRSETDRGIIVLMDGRFLEPSYTQSMPDDWFKENPTELVSTSILKEVGDFWES